MDALSLIRKKRRGGELSESDIQWLVTSTVAGSLPGYQLAALLMVMCYEHLTYGETLALTRAFVDSGQTLSWPPGDRPVVDKHSTGGIGDKASLILLPWLAACGLRVPKLSGRGLGITGGTIDKLDSIPGFRTNLGQQELARILDEVGCALASQSSELALADKLFYSLRDATDTVDELGLIAASVMSKKIALGAERIVLDVKCGSGAFFYEQEAARRFCDISIKLGQEFGRQVACVISNMQQPLGYCIGNALEVKEALQFARLQLVAPDLRELCETLGACLLVMTGRADDFSHAAARLAQVMESGALWQKMETWIAAQGGMLPEFERRLALDAQHEAVTVQSPRTGFIASADALQLGELAHSLGAGRVSAEDQIDHMVGIELLRQVGSPVEAGEAVAVITVPTAVDHADVQERCLRALSFSAEPVAAASVVLEIVGL